MGGLDLHELAIHFVFFVDGLCTFPIPLQLTKFLRFCISPSIQFFKHVVQSLSIKCQVYGVHPWIHTWPHTIRMWTCNLDKQLDALHLPYIHMPIFSLISMLCKKIREKKYRRECEPVLHILRMLCTLKCYKSKLCS